MKKKTDKMKMLICFAAMSIVIGCGGFAAGKLLKANKPLIEHGVTFTYAFIAGMLGQAASGYLFKKRDEETGKSNG